MAIIYRRKPINTFSIATTQKIEAYRKSDLCTKLCGRKPFGSRHWEYPWAVEQSGVLSSENLRILDVAPDFTFPYAGFLEASHGVTFIDLEKRQWSDTVFWGVDGDALEHHKECRVMDVRELAFSDETFDIIFCISVLEHLVCPTQDPDHPDLARLFSPKGAQKAVKEMRRCLKTGGKLVLTIDIYGGRKWKSYFDTWDIVADLACAGFDVQGLNGFDREKIFNDPETFISDFHGPYITLGGCLIK